MQKKQEQIALILFENNLRIHDNLSLNKALSTGLNVVGVFCFQPEYLEPNEWGITKIGYFRMKFLLEALENLQKNLAELKIPLIVSFKSLKITCARIAEKFEVKEVFVQAEWTFEETQRISLIKQIFSKAKFTFSYDQLLIQPKHLPFKIEETPLMFTEFRKRVEKTLKGEAPIFSDKKCDASFFSNFDKTKIPDANDFFENIQPLNSHSAFPFKGGEDEALHRLDYYLFESKLISNYKETRNGLLGTDYSSKFSPWLALGCLSPRIVYQKVKKYESEVEQNESTYWLIFELLWREFFKYTSMKYGNSIFHLNGFNKKNKAYAKRDKTAFRLWSEGKTGVDFVDANMRELNATGFMSNRGRQNVASYWCNDLKQDWRLAASYFEMQLVDYDVHSNWLNWAYIAGVGNDPRPDRYFNIEKQAQNYDPDKSFRKLWLQH